MLKFWLGVVGIVGFVGIAIDFGSFFHRLLSRLCVRSSQHLHSLSKISRLARSFRLGSIGLLCQGLLDTFGLVIGHLRPP